MSPTNQEIESLTATLHETERRLEELIRGQEDTLASRTGRSIQLQRAQEQSRHRYADRQAAILDALPANLALLDARGMIISVNEKWRRFALANEMRIAGDGIGHNYLAVCAHAIGPDAALAGEVAVGIRSVLGGQASTYSVEYPCHSPTERRWFQMTVTPLADHYLEGAVVMHIDVTGRKQAEEVLRESEDRFAGAFEHAPIGVALVSPEGRWLRVNRALCELFGYTEAELLTRTIQDLTHPDDVGLSLENIRRAVAGEFRSFQIEKRYLHKRGHTITALLSISLIRDEQGHPKYFVSQIQDTTERKVVETALHNSDQTFHLLADNITDTFWIRSADMRKVHYVSPAFERIWGRSVDSVYSNPHLWSEFVVPEDRDRVLASFSALTGDAPTLDIEYRIARPDGEIRWVRARGFQVRDDQGRLIRNIGIVSDITDSHRAAEALRASEAEFRTLAEAMPQIVWIRGAAGENVYLNQRWMDYTGLTLTESLGEEWKAPFHPDDQQQAADAWLRATANADTYSVEIRLRRADGIYRWWLMRGVPLKDAAGNILKWFGTCTDVHDLKMAELEISRSNRELRENRRRFTDLLGNVEMVSMMLDTEGRITYCNDYLLRLTGWRRDEVIGQNWFERFVPSHRDDTRVVFANLLAGDLSSRHHENEILTRTGEERLVQWHNTVLCSATGDVIGSASLGEDITERKRAEAKLHLQSAALNAADNAILITGRDHSIVWSNPAFAALTGYTNDESLGMNAQELLQLGTATELDPALSEAILAGQSWSGEMTIRRKDGSLYPEAQTITPVKDGDGAITHFISIRTDLTAQRHLERQLRESQKMEAVGQLAAGVAHEFNNLLQALMSMSAIIRFRAGNPEVSTMGADMESLIKRGAGLTQQLLLFSRHRLIEKAHLDLNEELQKASELLRHLIPETVRIVVEMSPEPLSFEGDSGQIQQVLLNLAINARDAMAAGGTLTLRDGRAGDEVFLDVEDTGHGIDAATRARLFEPFFTTKEPGKGTGLGLAVAHGIVEQHGGHIEVLGRPGEGTLFRVFLPRSSSRGETATEPSAEASVSLGGGRVLLVEDDIGVRTGISILLELLGCDVVSAGSGEEALALVLDPPPEILLSDVTLPGIAGPLVAAKMLERFPSLRIILMSGYVEEELRVPGWHFLQKPFELADLARELRGHGAPAVTPPI